MEVSLLAGEGSLQSDDDFSRKSKSRRGRYAGIFLPALSRLRRGPGRAYHRGYRHPPEKEEDDRHPQNPRRRGGKRHQILER